jgi:hypothetical protein
MMAPIMESAAQEFAPIVRFLTMDTDAHPATMVKLGVFPSTSCANALHG